MIVKDDCATVDNWACHKIRRRDANGALIPEDAQPDASQTFDHSVPSRLKFPVANVTTGAVTDEHLMGRMAHELGHKLGLDGGQDCDYEPSIMRGGNFNGTRDHVEVFPIDIETANFALSNPQSCIVTVGNNAKYTRDDSASLMPSWTPEDLFWSDALRAEKPQARSIARTLPVLPLVVVFVLIVGCRKDPEPLHQPMTGLQKLAAEVRAAGRDAIVTEDKIERYETTKLEEVLSVASIVVVEAEPNPVTVATESTVHTWQRFRAIEWLQRKAPPYGAFIGCPSLAPPFAASEDHVATALAKGTVVVDRVKITEATEAHIEFDPGRTYILVGIDCPSEFMLLWGSDSVFALSSDGRILIPPYNDGVAPFVNQLSGLRTRNALLDRIRRDHQSKNGEAVK